MAARWCKAKKFAYSCLVFTTLTACFSYLDLALITSPLHEEAYELNFRPPYNRAQMYMTNRHRKAKVRNTCRKAPALELSPTSNLFAPSDNGRVIKRMHWRQLYRDLENKNTSFYHKKAAPRWWRSHIHVNEKYNLVYCHIPKIASRNLLRYLIKLSEPWLTDEYIASLQVHTNTTGLNHITGLGKYRRVKAMKLLRKSKKFVFTRNPLERLLSAWFDKLYSWNPVFARRHGRRIIKTFRRNATDREIEKGSPVFLEEFLRYVDTYPLPTRFFDPHWKPMHEVCFFCAIRYDFIGKLENIQLELDYFMRTAIRNGSVVLPKLMKSRPSVPKLKDHRYQELKNVPRSLVERVLMKYKLDYEMFGYDIAKDLREVYGY